MDYTIGVLLSVEGRFTELFDSHFLFRLLIWSDCDFADNWFAGFMMGVAMRSIFVNLAL